MKKELIEIAGGIALCLSVAGCDDYHRESYSSGYVYDRGVYVAPAPNVRHHHPARSFPRYISPPPRHYVNPRHPAYHRPAPRQFHPSRGHTPSRGHRR